ncbi:MAG: acyl-CoA dehydrogenase [Candidatus Manganitrophaceae bacterium]|nr:MAG: acyl-CoA dehydrogenase [Candidatus Manganitrophaceae bacterium]
MLFPFTEEQRLLQRTLREFVAREVAPRAAAIDREERFPAETFARLGALGLLGIAIPKEYGGVGGDFLSAALAMEALAAGCASTALSFGAHAFLCAQNLYTFGNEVQRRRFLPALCTGEKIGAFALTEPDAGSDATSLKTTATREGNVYRLNGAKMFITNASVAGIFLVFARTAEDQISLFAVERDAPGITVGRPMEKLGMRGSPTCEVVFRETPVPVEHRLGEEGDGVHRMVEALNRERSLFSALPVGIAQAAFDAALAYSKDRAQFGRPIAQFQLIQEMLAEMATDLQAARLLTYQAAVLLDAGQGGPLAASHAKLYGGEMVMRVTNRAIQIFGGYGYIREFPVERLMRDARLISIGGGTAEIQKLIIARELLKSTEV